MSEMTQAEYDAYIDSLPNKADLSPEQNKQYDRVKEGATVLLGITGTKATLSLDGSSMRFLNEALSHEMARRDPETNSMRASIIQHDRGDKPAGSVTNFLFKGFKKSYEAGINNMKKKVEGFNKVMDVFLRERDKGAKVLIDIDEGSNKRVTYLDGLAGRLAKEYFDALEGKEARTEYVFQKKEERVESLTRAKERATQLINSEAEKTNH